MKDWYKISQILTPAMNKKRGCMAYEKNSCKGNIVNSHIISKKYLKNISTDGYVIIPKSNPFQVSNTIQFYNFNSEGLSKVTTAPIFCEKHDNVLFESFENEDFCGRYDQMFSITLRALFREYYQKKNASESSFDKNFITRLDKTGYTNSDSFKKQQMHCRQEVKDHKFLYEQLQQYNKDGLQFLLAKTSKMPIASTGVLFPLYDFKKNKIQSQKGSQLGFIYNVIPLTEYSYVLLATVKSLHNKTHKIFLETINLKNKAHLNRFITYLFFNNDNTAIEPDWFNKLSDDFKKELSKLQNLQVGHYGATSGFSSSLNFIETFQNFKIHYIKSNY